MARTVVYEIKDVQMVTKMTKTNKPYQVAHVTYRDDQGKLAERDIMPFGNQANSNKFLSTAAPGFYTITLEKNDAGFNDWVSVTAGEAVQGNAAPTARPAGGASPAPRNTYETPEERAIKQKYIVRQSSLTNAISLFELDKKHVPTIQEVIATAKAFEDYVFGVKQQEEGGLGGLNEIEDDIPL